MTDPAAETAAKPEIATLSFEQALAELEAIVSRLEQGKSSLDDAIGAYERGAALKAHCEAKLREAREKVERITLDTAGQPTGTQPFET
ncbi:MAG: exodeoxyribonuclease VII small subunit [Alphaproteobacteria bacterium]|nr:exodeoxyribonuclease VII small subunit [Alphaproteobacteria bacterium]MCB9928380.1 exodeoxyribonuclease VII small subunit [Alphaproteobacteria bacterium]